MNVFTHTWNKNNSEVTLFKVRFFNTLARQKESGQSNKCTWCDALRTVTTMLNWHGYKFVLRIGLFLKWFYLSHYLTVQQTGTHRWASKGSQHNSLLLSRMGQCTRSCCSKWSFCQVLVASCFQPSVSRGKSQTDFCIYPLLWVLLYSWNEIWHQCNFCHGQLGCKITALRDRHNSACYDE